MALEFTHTCARAHTLCWLQPFIPLYFAVCRDAGQFKFARITNEQIHKQVTLSFAAPSKRLPGVQMFYPLAARQHAGTYL